MDFLKILFNIFGIFNLYLYATIIADDLILKETMQDKTIIIVSTVLAFITIIAVDIIRTHRKNIRNFNR